VPPLVALSAATAQCALSSASHHDTCQGVAECAFKTSCAARIESVVSSMQHCGSIMSNSGILFSQLSSAQACTCRSSRETRMCLVTGLKNYRGENPHENVRTCIYVYICMCVCICICMHLYTCVCVCVCIFIHRLWVSVSVLQRVDCVMHAHVYSCAYVCVCICV